MGPATRGLQRSAARTWPLPWEFCRAARVESDCVSPLWEFLDGVAVHGVGGKFRIVFEIAFVLVFSLLFFVFSFVSLRFSSFLFAFLHFSSFFIAFLLIVL